MCLFVYLLQRRTHVYLPTPRSRGTCSWSLRNLFRYAEAKRRALPTDQSPIKGNISHGITYAFTKGMMPWAKESTRIHMLAYLRGIGFHVGIFAAIGAVIISPFWPYLSPLLLLILSWVLILGAVLGAAGGIMRIAEHNLRGLSLPDDHFAVWLTTLFITVAGLAVFNETFVIPLYIVSAITFVYVPLGKIRHCLYFFFSHLLWEVLCRPQYFHTVLHTAKR
jgi:hypothetical protein